MDRNELDENSQATTAPPGAIISAAARSAFEDAVAAPDFDMLEAMVLLESALDPDADPEQTLTGIQDVTAFVGDALGNTDGIARLYRFVDAMRLAGFQGNTENYHDPWNTMIGRVVGRRTGIPISLAIVYAEVARRLGLALHGVNFPYHFLLTADDVPGRWIDPFFGIIRDRHSCDALLRELSGGTLGLLDSHLQAVPSRDVIVRVLRNLKTLHKRNGSVPDAVDYCDLILRVDPELPPEYRDRGTLSLALGEWNRAIDDLSTYLAMRPTSPDRATVLAQLQWVLEQQTAVH